MFDTSLPEKMAGSWIWLPDEERKANRRVYARKEFMLEGSISSAELIITSLPFYHVYINGEHVGYGPASATHKNCYLDSYDVTQYLESGINTIAIAVMDQTAINWYAHPYPPKFWCQLFADEQSVITTGADWKITEVNCSSIFQPRCHFGMEKCEKIHLNTQYTDWNKSGYDDSTWSDARVLATFPEGEPVPAVSGTLSCFWSESEAFDAFEMGTYKDKHASVYYSYTGYSKLIPGNYAAQSYAFSMYDCETTMQISSDDPFAIFCNDEPVAFGQHNRALDQIERPHSPKVGMEILQETRIRLKKGWNRFLCFQETVYDSMGLMLLFPELKKGALTFRREESNIALTGWKICGPLRMPLPFSSASISLDHREDTVEFLPVEDHINDISAYLGKCEFEFSSTVNPVNLKQGEFVIYDLGHFCYGFPYVDINGTAGDIVDITCGLKLEDKMIKTISSLGRMTDTVILGEKHNSWIRMVPRGARYIMISVRRSNSGVFPIIRFISSNSELGSDNSFHSSDDLLNSVFQRAVDSLQQCTGSSLIDDPCARRCQILPEAYIYARTLYSLFGGKEIAEKALREFAEGQLENGMILKIVPSGVYSYAPDTALIWILWLEDHWMHTGDIQFLSEMEPYLTDLLDFFRKRPSPGDVLLPSEKAGHCSFLNKTRTLEEKGIFTMLNALYFKALTAATHLYLALTMKDHVINCISMTRKVAEDLQNHNRNPKTGIYADCYDGERSSGSSMHTNMFILYSGMITDPKEAEQLLKFACADPNLMLDEYSSPFFFFILDTLLSYGRRSLAMELIKKSASLSIDRVCIYEKDGNPHISCIIAADLIIREFLGVRPSVPGASQIYFNPACDYLNSIKCKLPAGNGERISIAWNVENRDINVSIDSSSQLDVLPMIPPKYGATFDLGNYVNMLDPNSAK